MSWVAWSKGIKKGLSSEDKDHVQIKQNHVVQDKAEEILPTWVLWMQRVYRFLNRADKPIEGN